MKMKGEEEIKIQGREKDYIKAGRNKRGVTKGEKNTTEGEGEKKAVKGGKRSKNVRDAGHPGGKEEGVWRRGRRKEKTKFLAEKGQKGNPLGRTYTMERKAVMAGNP